MFEQLEKFKEDTGLDFEDYVEDDKIILNNLISPSEIQTALIEAGITDIKVVSDTFTVFVSYYNHTFIRTVDIISPFKGQEKFIYEYKNGFTIVKHVSLSPIETKYFDTSYFINSSSDNSYAKEIETKLNSISENTDTTDIGKDEIIERIIKFDKICKEVVEENKNVHILPCNN